MSIFEQLKAEFPREAVSWRAQNVTKDGDKALALAYIDARDVMNRLDDVCGPENWQDSYVETAKGRIICTISIRVPVFDDGQQWVSKSDGAGDTDIEGDKGGISDAFKRAAVKWGIGRYLYDIESPWVPCTSWKNDRQKWVWKQWKDDPWKYVNAPPKAAPKQRTETYETLNNLLDQCKTTQECVAWLRKNKPILEELNKDEFAAMEARYAQKKAGFTQVDQLAA